MKFKNMLLVAGATALAGILPISAEDEKPPTIARYHLAHLAELFDPLQQNDIHRTSSCRFAVT